MWLRTLSPSRLACSSLRNSIQSLTDVGPLELLVLSIHGTRHLAISSDAVDVVRVTFFSCPRGTHRTISIGCMDGSGNYPMTVPADLPAGSGYKIRCGYIEHRRACRASKHIPRLRLHDYTMVCAALLCQGAMTVSLWNIAVVSAYRQSAQRCGDVVLGR